MTLGFEARLQWNSEYHRNAWINIIILWSLLYQTWKVLQISISPSYLTPIFPVLHPEARELDFIGRATLSKTPIVNKISKNADTLLTNQTLSYVPQLGPRQHPGSICLFQLLLVLTSSLFLLVTSLETMGSLMAVVPNIRYKKPMSWFIHIGICRRHSLFPLPGKIALL